MSLTCGAGVMWRHWARKATGRWEQGSMSHSSRELGRMLRGTDAGVQLRRFRRGARVLLGTGLGATVCCLPRDLCSFCSCPEREVKLQDNGLICLAEVGCV